MAWSVTNNPDVVALTASRLTNKLFNVEDRLISIFSRLLIAGARDSLEKVKISIVFRIKQLKYLYYGRRPITGIQMKQKELTKTFMINSNWKTFCFPWLYK